MSDTDPDETAATDLEDTDDDVTINLIDELTEIRGVGEATAEEIVDVIETTPLGAGVEEETGDVEVDTDELAALLDEALDHLADGEFGDVLAERGAEYVQEARALLD